MSSFELDSSISDNEFWEELDSPKQLQPPSAVIKLMKTPEEELASEWDKENTSIMLQNIELSHVEEAATSSRKIVRQTFKENEDKLESISKKYKSIVTKMKGDLRDYRYIIEGQESCLKTIRDNEYRLESLLLDFNVSDNIKIKKQSYEPDLTVMDNYSRQLNDYQLKIKATKDLCLEYEHDIIESRQSISKDKLETVMIQEQFKEEIQQIERDFQVSQSEIADQIRMKEFQLEEHRESVSKTISDVEDVNLAYNKEIEKLQDELKTTKLILQDSGAQTVLNSLSEYLKHMSSKDSFGKNNRFEHRNWDDSGDFSMFSSGLKPKMFFSPTPL